MQDPGALSYLVCISATYCCCFYLLPVVKYHTFS